MAAADVIFFQERLASKEQELGELKSAFHKYKLKQKVKYDNLKKDVYAYCRSTGQATVDEKENVALLQIKMAEMETELEEARARVENLTEELDKSQEQLKDQMTVIRSMENSLKEMSPSREPRDSKFDKKQHNQLVDMDRIQQQMLYKDQRIIELNNNILEKERQILDLQEMCREQGEVADAKKQAMRLVQKKFEEMESKNRREVGTETDPWFPTTRERDSTRGGRAGGASRSLSPGHAVVSRAAGGSSPPPLDPQLQNGQNFPLDDDEMLPGTSSGFQGRNLDEELSLRTKQKKRVTFDLPPSLAASSINLNEGDDGLYIQLNETIARLTEENAKLMADVEYKNNSLTEAKKLLDDSEQEIAKLLRDTKNSTLKARAVAHSRIRELEESLAELNEQHLTEVNRLTTENETLRNTREWEVEQNGLLRDHIDKLREKNTKLTTELDATGIVNRDLEKKLDESRELMEGVTTELCEAEELVIFLEDQKESILDDVEKMKEAIFAQDQFIDLLEADIVIYEEHVGLLRDSLGASKVDHRALLRSKAFETKLKALEQEKEQISIKSREEKLKTKALAQKVKILEDEIEKLTEQLCTRAMGAADDEEMVETCRLLEARLHESEENMKIERARFEIELAGHRVENKQRLAECEELRFRIYALENELRREQEPGGSRGGQDQHHQHHQLQTQLAQQAAVSQETEELREKVTQQEAKIKELLQNINCLETELDAVRGTNFELTDRVKEFDELERDYDELVEKHRQTCVELVSAKEALDRLQTEAVHPRELEVLLQRATGAEEEVRVLRIELETARQQENHTATIQRELETVKIELEREKAATEEVRNAPREEDYKRIATDQANFARMGLLEAALAESETEKQELRLMLDRVQEMEYVKAVERKESSTQNLKALVEQNQTLEQAVEQHKATEEQLLAKINDLELEASLAGELSVEMGRVIQQFEKQIKELEFNMTKSDEKSHSAEMELRLHEMLNEELGRQLDEHKEREKLHQKETEELEQLRNSSQELENRIKEAQVTVEKKETELNATKKKNALLVQQIQDLEEKLTTSVQQTNEAKVELEEKKETVQQVEGELKEMRQEQGEQEIQRVVHQVQQAPSPQVSQGSQHHHSWNWGQAGYSPPYLQSEATVSQTPTVVVQQDQQPHHQAENQPHQVYHYQQATVSQEQQYHGHGDSRDQAHSHEAVVSQSHHQQSAVQEQQFHGHHGHSHGHSHEARPSQPLQYQVHQPPQQPQYCQEQQHHGHGSQHDSHGHHQHQHAHQTPNYGQQIQDQVQPTVSQEHGHSGHSHSHEGPDHHQHDAHVHFAELVQHEERPQPVSQSRESFVEQVQSENELLRQCVNETIQLREDMTHDVEKLLELKNELEVAVDALKGEIWTLNGQLKASILDRENLQDRVVELDTSLIEEKKKVASLDVELSEQQELIEKATRQAAEAENESNRQLAECHEMESRRVELEQAYSQLTEYYNQLQAAYNLLYAQQQGESAGVQQSPPNVVDPALVAAINTFLEELSLPVVDEDIRSKLNAIQGKIREKMMEVEQLHTAVAEQHKVARALESRLEAVEEEKQANGGEQLELKERVHQLEGDLEWKQEECDSLRRQVDELQHALNSIIVNDGDDAAKLATRQADVDSLFRTNAELAHTNVRLQNELDDREEAGVQGTRAGEGGEEEAQILAEKVQELEKKLAEWTDSKEEIERLKNIEKILNNRILSLEDQLLEKEEQLQEMEDQLMESQGGDSDRLSVLEQANSAVIAELEELRTERDTLRANIQIMEKDRELRKEEAKAKEQELQSREEEVKQYEEELDDLKTELLVMKQKMLEKEEQVQVERVQQTQSAWGDWEEKEESVQEENNWKERVEQLTKELEELNNVKRRLEAVQDEQEVLKLRNIELEEELTALTEANQQKAQNDDVWGEWDEKEPSDGDSKLLEEVDNLKSRLDAAQEEQETLKLRNIELEEELAFMLEANQKKVEESKQDEAWGDWKDKKESGDDVEELKDRLQSTQEEHETLQRKYKELQSEFVGWKAAHVIKIVEEQPEMNQMSHELNSARVEEEALKAKNLELEEQLALLLEKTVNEGNHEKNTEDMEVLKNKQEEQKALQLRNTELEEELAALKELQKKEEESWGDWGEKDGSENKEELKTKLGKAQQEIEEFKLRNMDLEEELAALQETNRKYLSQGNKADWQQEAKDHAEEVRQLQDEIEELKGLLDSSQAKEKDDAWGDWEEKKDVEEVTALQKEVEDLKARLDEYQQEREELTEELTKLKEKPTDDNWRDDWNEKSEDLQKLQEEISELKNRLDLKEQEQENLKLRNTELEEEMEALLESNQKLLDNKVSKELEENVIDLQNRLEKSLQDQKDHKLRNTELEEELTALMEANQQKEQKGDAWGEWDEKEPSGEDNKLQEEVESLKSRLDAAQEEQEALKLRNTELEEELAFMLEANQKKVEESKQEAWGDWEDKKETGEDVEKLQGQVKTLTGTVEALQQEHIVLNARNVHLEQEIAKLLVPKEEKEEAWGDWEEKKEEETGLKRELQEKEEKIKEILEEVNEAKEEIEEKDKKIQELQEQLSIVVEKKENWGEWGEDGNEMEQLKVENEELRQRLEGLEKSENEARIQLQKALKATKTKKGYSQEQNEVEKLKYELEERDRERSKLEAVITRVEKENEDLMGQLEGGPVDEKRKAEDDMAYTLFEFQKEIQRLREENSRLQVTTSQNVQSSGDNPSSAEDFSQKQKELEETQNKLSALTTTLESVENNYLASRKEAQRRQSDLEKRIRSLEEELETAQSGAEKLSAKVEKMTAVEKRLAEVEKQNNLLKESEGRLLESVDEYGALADKNQEEVDRLQRVVNSLEEERAQLLEELERLKTEITALKTFSQPKENNPALKKELEALRTERDSLKSKLTAMEGKLAEIEKEKSQIKAAYDQLRAKIQARRAAATSSAASSRAPSRASVASEIREDPVELTYQPPAQTLHVQGNSYAQDIDDRVQQFVEEVKEFMSRVDSIATTSQANLEEADRSLGRLMARKCARREEAFVSTPQSSAQTEEEPIDQDSGQVEELKNTVQNLKGQLEEQTAELEEAARRYQEFAARVDENDILSQTAINDLAGCNRLLQSQLHDSQLEIDRVKLELREKYEELEAIAVENERFQMSALSGLVENRTLSAHLGMAQTELQSRIFLIQELEDQLRAQVVNSQGAVVSLPPELDSHEEEVKKTLLETIDKLETGLEEEEMEKEVVLEEWDKLKKALEDSQQELAAVRMRNIQLEEELSRLEQDTVSKNTLDTLKSELDFTTTAQEALQLKNTQLEVELSSLMAAKELENGQLREKEEELEELKTELLMMKQKIIEQEDPIQVERIQQKQSAWEDWEEKEESVQEEDNWKERVEQLKKELEELNNVKRRLEAAQDGEQEALKLRNTELEEKMEALLESNQKLLDNTVSKELEENVIELQNRLEKSIQDQEDLKLRNIELEEELTDIMEANQNREQKDNAWGEWDQKEPSGEDNKLREEAENLKSRLDAAQEEQEALKLRNTEVEEDLDQARELTSRLEEDKLDEQLRHRQLIGRLQEELIQLVGHLEQTKKEQEKLLLKNDQLKEELSRASEYEEGIRVNQYNSFSRLQNDLEELVGLLEKSKSDQTKLEERNGALEGELANLRQGENDWEEKEEHFHGLEQSIGELEELRGRLAQLEEELLLVTQERTSEMAEIGGETDSTPESGGIERLTQELEYLKQKNIDLEMETSSYQEQLLKLKAALEKAQKAQDILTKKNNQLEEEAEVKQAYFEQENQAQELEKELQEIKNNVDSKERELEQKESEKNELEARIWELEDKIRAIEPLEGENSRLVDELSSTQAEIATLTVKIRELEQETSRIHSEQVQKSSGEDENSEVIQALEKENEELERRLLELTEILKRERGEVKQKAKELEAAKGEMERLRRQVDELNQEIQQLSVDREGFEEKDTQIQRLQMELSSVTQELAQSVDNISQFEDQITRLEKEKEQLLADNSKKIQETALELDAVNQRVEHLTRELKITQEEKEELRSQVNYLTEEKIQLTREQELLREKKTSLQELQEDVDRVREELAFSSDKVTLLENQIVQLKAEKEQILEAKGSEIMEKAIEFQTVEESLNQQVAEWRQRFELAYADLCQLHPALQQAQEHISNLMVQNTGLQQQLEQRVPVAEEEVPGVLQLHPVESAPAILQLEDTVQADITKESTSETRISIEQEVEKGASTAEAVEEDDTRPILSEFDDFIGQASNSRFVRAGAPITQPLIRQIRAVWGRRAFRPYFRYFLSIYFVFVHFLVFSSWFNPC